MQAYRTAEVRWFMPGEIPDAARSWFDALGPAPRSGPGHSLEAETRADLYLAPASDALGVKLREGRIEAKRRTGRLGALDLEGGSVEVEAWAKWSFETPTDLEDGSDWLEVAKTRWQRHAAGCSLELSRIVGFAGLAALEGEPWWSVCLEATGADDGECRAVLEDGARRWLGEGAPSLRPADAYGYPAWLIGRRR